MSHLSDKDLDRLSREAAEQFDVGGTTSGWEVLEKKLDKEMPTEQDLRKRKWWGWLGLFLLMITISGLLLGLYNDNGFNSITITGNNDLQVKEQNENISDQEKKATQGSASGNHVSQDKKTTESSNTFNGKSINNRQEENERQKGHNVADDRPSNTANDPLVQKKNDIASKTGNDIASGTDKDQQMSPTDDHTNFPDKMQVFNNGNKDLSPDEALMRLNRTALPFKYDKAIIDINIAAQTIEKYNYTPIVFNNLQQQTSSTVQEKKKPASSANRPFEIGILAGTDFSNVRFKGGDQPGYNFGISFGYNYNKRWQVNTGIIYTTKRYFAKGSDYKPLHDYWTNYVDLDYLSGECFMWEIPLLIRYNLSIRNRGNWFASTGFSTYLMKREKYEYYYTQNGLYQNKYKDYPSDEKYFFGIFHLSAGYEKNINDRFSIQFEPYLKMPLKGVGYGRMQLNSLGTNFSLKMKMGR